MHTHTRAAVSITLLATLCVVPAFAQSAAPVIRTLTGVRYEIPAGWEWTEFDGHAATLRHVATKSGEKGKESSPNSFQIAAKKIYGNDYTNSWGRLDRDHQRAFSNGTTARWRAGTRFLIHYAFLGEATVDSKALSVTVLDTRTPSFDVSLLEAAFLSAVGTAQSVPPSRRLYHPSAGIAVDDVLKSPWIRYAYREGIRFSCHPVQDACGKDGAQILVYPAQSFPDTRTALADITGFFEKERRVTIGKIQRAEVPGGEVLWTEQPGADPPFLGVVQRDGRHFFLYVSSGAGRTRAHDTLREDVLAVAKGLHAWDGK